MSLTQPQQTENEAYYREILHDLIDMGSKIARLVHNQAEAAAKTQNPLEDPTIAFDRIARAIRRTIALARALDKPQRATPDRTAARKQIIRRVEDNIGSDIKGPGAEILREELLDRLDAPEFENDLENLSIDQIIKQICADIGLPGISGLKPWKRRTPEQIKTLHARAEAPPGSIRPPPLPPLPPAGEGRGEGGAPKTPPLKSSCLHSRQQTRLRSPP